MVPLNLLPIRNAGDTMPGKEFESISFLAKRSQSLGHDDSAIAYQSSGSPSRSLENKLVRAKKN
jgi:hypothetical protein